MSMVNRSLVKEDLDPKVLLQVLKSVRRGDFTAQVPVEWTGIGGKIADELNAIIEHNGKIIDEIKRVSHVVGKKGRLSERVSIPDATGAWKLEIEAFNGLINDLVRPMNEMARVIGGVAKGDLTQTVALETEDHHLKGEFLKTARTVNEMVRQLDAFAAEVTRVAREVGTEGKLGGQAVVPGVAGTWKDLTENVNSMASNLTNQVRNIADVTIAVASGDLSKKITADVRGEILQLKEAINTMVDQLRSFGAEVTRVAREVGTEGKLGGQAVVPGVAGTWKDLTDSVNAMASNLTGQVRNIADVTTAVANGDLSKKITVDVRGEILQLKDTINTMVDQLRSFAAEVTRVAREVGTEGKLGGQATVPGVAGTWKDLTENVNSMASNLTNQVRNIADVTTAVANGDLSKKITADVRGEILQLKEAINTMVDQLRSFGAEVTRVAREVGTEGKLGGQAVVPGVAGTWKDLTDSVNSMASNLTGQVRNIADVTIAVANGDLSKKITVDVHGEILQLKEAINTMVDQLRSFAAEVTRVAREVGTEGKLGGQAQVSDVSGVWKDLTDSVNSMASNLTGQVRNIAEVTIAVAKGDLSKKITVDVHGEILQLKDTINTMVDQLRSFAAEVTRVAREVGTEGKLGGQAQVRDVSGVWKDLTESVNLMGGNLTAQVRNIADVTIAVANGDLSKKITVDVRGEILQLKEAINTMVDQLRSFAAEVTRVAREVGTEGKLGGQATVPGVAGTWKDLTDGVNSMASNLTGQVRNIAEVTTAVANGDLSKKITVDVRGEILQLKDTINTMVDQLNAFAAEVTRVAREVGTEGKLGGQATVPGVAGTWKDLTDSVNSMASNLTGQVRNIAEVTFAVASGDLSKKITADVRGEILQLKEAINTMVDQLRSFGAEVTRVAREVGTEGKLGGQAVVPGVAGTWKDLTDNVNAMASNLTVQLRDMSKVATAIANGDLTRKVTVEVRGEILQIKDVINRMVDQLGGFASEVTRVAREVGTEGKLGGQAAVPGVAGTWKDLTESVNLLAANLTTQVRAIAEVATAVTQGDLSRSIQVQARGEVAELKDNINAMIRTLRATTDQNTEQDWLKTNLAKFTRMMQGQRDLVTVGQMLLSELTQLVNAQYGVVYQMQTIDGASVLKPLASFASDRPLKSVCDTSEGNGLVGQCAVEKRRLLLTDIPPNYVTIRSGLGEAVPRTLVVLPVLFEGQTKAVIELASLSEFTPTHLALIGQLTETIGVVVNTIEATMRTEGLLQQSQKLAGELQTQQRELQQTNEELANKAQQLAEQNAEVERKNREIEQARHALEEKAGELALASKYKSEFLANMSHELRTPLNSILILAQQLGDNPQHNLTMKQVEFSKNIHAAGADLLNLISDILDLSKIESGTVTVEPEQVSFVKVREAVERSFRHVAESRHLAFNVDIDSTLPRGMVTDFKRLQQVLKNLLSNAFKFTSQGNVTFRIRRATTGWTLDHHILTSVPSVLAFEVQDTGIGIPQEKQKIVFEAFQQAEAGTSRRYGGTGLGLAISRELAMLLGGEIRLNSVPDEGSTFTLYLPEMYMGDAVSSVRVTPRMNQPAASLVQQVLVQQAERFDDIPDDRETLVPGEPTILIVEDDAHYARVLLGLAREKGFKGIVTAHGRLALSLARQYNPVAVTLDIFLPDMLGWTVLSHLKQDPETRHIPVQILSVEEERIHGLGHGAYAYILKPLTTQGLGDAFDRLVTFAQLRRKKLLLVEDNEIERQSLALLLGHDDVDIATAANGAQAWEALTQQSFDCVVLDLRLPDMSGFDILERIRQESSLQNMPVIVFTGKELTQDEELRLRDLSQSIVLKGVQSPERLLDEATLFLHLLTAQLPPEKREMLERVRRSDDSLIGKKILVVDDDVRNIFALTSLLELHGMAVTSCETGREAIQRVESDSDLDMVLMDIMMPEMDGYETMRTIRSNPAHRLLPILALTAKAMKGDRERCLHAGASDYIAKPVNTDELLSLMRIWLFGKKKVVR
ncbi:MAG: HAMP domain-containing protein [Nitrospira sp.]|nr:HAMP domain-containing protein [Nitrospira sp. BO4]